MKAHEFLYNELYGWPVGAEKLSDQAVRSFAEEIVPDVECRFCGEPVPQEEFDSVRTYFQPHQLCVCHARCKAKGVREEIIACQTLDADCNDCKHFVRGRSIGTGMWSGHCKKFDKPTKAYALMCTAHECFEHRRS